MISPEYKTRLQHPEMSVAVGYSKELLDILRDNGDSILEAKFKDKDLDPYLIEVFHEIITSFRKEIFNEVEENESSSYELFLALYFYIKGKSLTNKENDSIKLLGALYRIKLLGALLGATVQK